MEKFKEIIREERRRLRLSQNELGERIGVSQKAVSKYERGDAIPPLDTFEKMADLFNVSADYLLGRTNKRNPSDSDETDLIRYFRSLTKPNRQLLLGKAVEIRNSQDTASVAADPSEAPSAKMAK